MEKITWHTEKRAIGELVPYAHNPRYISEKQGLQLRKSLEKFGLVELPVIDTDGVIVAGHQRLAILKTLGETGLIEVRVPDRKLTPDEFQEYNLRSNSEANAGEWDFDILANSFDENILADIGLDFMLPPDAPDEGELPADVPTTIQAGDMFTLGAHRLLCGDASDPAAAERLMQGDRATCVFTDPPYGVDIGKKNKLLNSFSEAERCTQDLAGDGLDCVDLNNVLKKAFILWRGYLADNCAIFVFCTGTCLPG